jgi:hypothetical protein
MAISLRNWETTTSYDNGCESTTTEGRVTEEKGVSQKAEGRGRMQTGDSGGPVEPRAPPGGGHNDSLGSAYLNITGPGHDCGQQGSTGSQRQSGKWSGAWRGGMGGELERFPPRRNTDGPGMA